MNSLDNVILLCPERNLPQKPPGLSSKNGVLGNHCVFRENGVVLDDAIVLNGDIVFDDAVLPNPHTVSDEIGLDDALRTDYGVLPNCDRGVLVLELVFVVERHGRLEEDLVANDGISVDFDGAEVGPDDCLGTNHINLGENVSGIDDIAVLADNGVSPGLEDFLVGPQRIVDSHVVDENPLIFFVSSHHHHISVLRHSLVLRTVLLGVYFALLVHIVDCTLLILVNLLDLGGELGESSGGL